MEDLLTNKYIYKSENIENAIEKVQKVALKYSINAFLIGGYVRDKLKNDISFDTDLDFTATEDNSINLAYAVSESYSDIPEPIQYETTGAIKLIINGIKCEFFGNKRKPYIIEELRRLDIEPTSFNKDVYGRDFTIDTICMDLNNYKIVDPTNNGVNDLLKDKILRTPVSPKLILEFNPFNILRAVRFCAQYDLNPVEELDSIIPEYLNYLKVWIQSQNKVSYTRMMMNKIMRYKNAKKWIEHWGLTDYLPETYGLESNNIMSNSWYNFVRLSSNEITKNIDKYSDEVGILLKDILNEEKYVDYIYTKNISHDNNEIKFSTVFSFDDKKPEYDFVEVKFEDNKYYIILYIHNIIDLFNSLKDYKIDDFIKIDIVDYLKETILECFNTGSKGRGESAMQKHLYERYRRRSDYKRRKNREDLEKRKKFFKIINYLEK